MTIAEGSKLRFNAIVESLGTTAKTISNWRQRKQVDFPSGPIRPGSWREFTAADLAVLALVLKMVEFGLPVTVASAFANSVLKAAAADRLPEFANAPPEAVLALCVGLRLLVWREGEQWLMRLDREPEGALQPAGAYLVIRLQEVLRPAVKRAFRVGAKIDLLGVRIGELTERMERLARALEPPPLPKEVPKAEGRARRPGSK